MATAPVAKDGPTAAVERAGSGGERARGRRPERRRPRTERSEDTDDALELAPPRGRLDIVA